MEYEIKLLGEQSALTRIFNNFVNAAPVIRDRHYAFNTYYLDDSSAFFDAGYSLRHRAGVPIIDKLAGTELKAVYGAINQVSARLEIGVRGKSPIDNYSQLMIRNDYPSDAPRISSEGLIIDFTTSVRRVERQALARIDNKDIIIEAALDDISYLQNMGKTGDGMFDTLLMPRKTEHELEFELKSECNTDTFFNWVSSNCIKDVAVEVTTKSKALRAKEYV